MGDVHVIRYLRTLSFWYRTVETSKRIAEAFLFIAIYDPGMCVIATLVALAGEDVKFIKKPSKFS